MTTITKPDEEYERFAIYFAPEQQSDLAQFAYHWLGVDAASGKSIPAPNGYVESPRKYGFHATLKAPMRLAESKTYRDLQSAVTALSTTLHSVDLGQLKLKAIGPFLALVVDPALHAPVADLAFQCVKQLDHLRAPLNDKERNKRQNLSTNQQVLLETWGYPYVGEEFRFHMTLTSALPADDKAKAINLLETRIPSGQTELNSICIFGDPGGSKTFRLIERFPLQV